MSKYYITNDLAVDSNEISTIAQTGEATLKIGTNAEYMYDLLIWVTYNHSDPILIGRANIFEEEIYLDDRNIFDDWQNLPFTKEEVKKYVAKDLREKIAYDMMNEIEPMR